ncbi:IPTL-CTERM sorting domain-containing protein [Brevundimonas variabilis]|uniref:IPTL-CTERM protein sorting domain-containing protein n=1 Tax=Brevundimonas variabilis TaxID=74312 RepID=A0A7W9FGP9_9CAUL|nr:hypothetical protein [Brevundimonas variabilis]
MKRILAILVLFAVWLPGLAFAQTISQLAGTSQVTSGGIGQSFTATRTGTLTQIQVRPRTSGTTTVRFYNGGLGSGTASAIGTPVSSQAVTLIDTGNNLAGLQTITLETPLPIVAGNSYSFIFDNANMAHATSDVYGGGTLLFDFATTFPGFDLIFTATEVTPAPVPTLSEWAMILFGLALAGGAALYIQRRQLIT